MTTAAGGLGPLQQAVDETLSRMTREGWAERLWASDGTLWSRDRDSAAKIAYWTGWLSVPALMQERAQEFEVARQEMGSRFDHVVLCGMGGSSLCPEVLKQTFGHREGSPELLVLDSTDPSTIAAVEARLTLERTLFLVSSKSGGTLETLSHYRYFHARMRAAGVANHGRHFVAITDEGSALHELAREQDFGHVFVNPPDIGGRYSALSYFGMVPAALMGLDQSELLRSALAMSDSCREPDAAGNPGLRLGAVLGAAATAARDKCTIVCSPDVATLGIWLEQLIAESTGKEGRGIVPVAGEPLGPPGSYGQDRLFVHVRSSAAEPEEDRVMEGLLGDGQPVFRIDIEGPRDLGGEFMRWEVATAAAGALIAINPFDQPNVQESKDNTKAVLAQILAGASIGDAPAADPQAEVAALLAGIAAGDYFAILAYTEPGVLVDHALQELRAAVGERFGIATTLGYGPRYLHSTGQLHKGGPGSGVYLVLSDNRGDDLPIPGEEFGFKTLVRAQWVGDLKSLRDHERRVAHHELGDDRVETIRRLTALVKGES